MKFMGDAVDEVGFHFGEFLLFYPVAEGDKEEQDYCRNG